MAGEEHLSYKKSQYQVWQFVKLMCILHDKEGQRPPHSGHSIHLHPEQCDGLQRRGIAARTDE
jgi:hypothetical protein